MSDPAMAASTEADIRTRFWVAPALTILVVLISPMGEMIGLRLPLSVAARSWAMLALTTPVVFWSGWIFIAGAFHSLASRRLDRSVLIAVGVLAAYLTGESLPVEKGVGGKVVGGSVDSAGSVKLKATGVGQETTLARIAKLVETAQNSKAPGQRRVDKAAAYLNQQGLVDLP